MGVQTKPRFVQLTLKSGFDGETFETNSKNAESDLSKWVPLKKPTVKRLKISLKTYLLICQTYLRELDIKNIR